MKTTSTYPTTALLSAVILLHQGSAPACPLQPESSKPVAMNGFEIESNHEGTAVREGTCKVLFYQRRAKSLDGKFTRANYVHPLYDLDGDILTEDFPEDHYHHRGVFWAWHYLTAAGKRVGDLWECKDVLQEVNDVAILPPKDGHTIILKIKAEWKSPRSKDASSRLEPLVEETTFLRIHRAAEKHRLVDFEIRLRALVEDLKLGGSEDEKGYGGFSIRMLLPDDLRFTGRDGPVEPQYTAVQAGPWLDFSGTFIPGNRIGGIAILQHPSLPGFPQPWILRSQRSMQNAKWPGRQPIVLATGEPVVLRYRVVIHRGDAREAGIDQLQRQYALE